MLYCCISLGDVLVHCRGSGVAGVPEQIVLVVGEIQYLAILYRVLESGVWQLGCGFCSEFHYVFSQSVACIGHYFIFRTCFKIQELRCDFVTIACGCRISAPSLLSCLTVSETAGCCIGRSRSGYFGGVCPYVGVVYVGCCHRRCLALCNHYIQSSGVLPIVDVGSSNIERMASKSKLGEVCVAKIYLHGCDVFVGHVVVGECDTFGHKTFAVIIGN